MTKRYPPFLYMKLNGHDLLISLMHSFKLLLSKGSMSELRGLDGKMYILWLAGTIFSFASQKSSSFT